MRWLFWLPAGLLGYTFGGYHWIISRLAARRPPLRPPVESPPGAVAAVVVACDEEARIQARIENLRACPLPLEVVIVSDGSRDRTAELARAAGARVIEHPDKLGKAARLSQVVPTLAADIVILADARQRFEPETIPRLVRHFADPNVGAVSGLLVIAEAGASGAAGGVGAYWKLETRLRAAEARLDSCIGCTGAVYAIRRALFRPIPADTILDDVVIPMEIAMRGARVLYDPEARAFDPQPLHPADEARRKARTLAGNYQMLARNPGWLLPWRNRLAWQLASHKYLRLAGPWLLVAIFIASVALRRRPFYAVALAAQVALYALAGAGIARPRLRSRAFAIPAGFLFLNWMSLRGLVRHLSGPATGAWESGRVGRAETR